MSPAPGTPHQRLVTELVAILHDYVGRHGLGEVLPGPFEIEFAWDTAVQPDVLVLLPERKAQRSVRRLYGAPSLAIEVVSYSSKRTDRLQTRELYQVEGVDEYWVVDPELRRVERWRPGAATPELLTDCLEWVPRPGVAPLVIDLGDLFHRPGLDWRRIAGRGDESEAEWGRRDGRRARRGRRPERRLHSACNVASWRLSA